ncbi:hypothetical protein CJF30_00004869 [Rutstroemia sp. NJR-2017a BBW]|nr:hypothetical protein CJF30_00004869 [Rutstroemia sp. NJR-2017a BBW]
MPAETDGSGERTTTSITDQIGKSGSSKTESTASDHPIHQDDEPKGDKVEFRQHAANPGPVVPNSMPEQEGSKEDRQAKTAELNKL